MPLVLISFSDEKGQAIGRGGGGDGRQTCSNCIGLLRLYLLNNGHYCQKDCSQLSR